MAGKPMVVIPITHDQPALAARLASLEVAEVIPERRLTVQLLRRAITTVLSSASYRQQASSLQKKIQAVDGLGYAVEIIENAMQSNEQRESNMPIASRSGFTTKRATC
jgi:UDP:flavonoid glycosyltransferase YjiC (YdhE family)